MSLDAVESGLGQDEVRLQRLERGPPGEEMPNAVEPGLKVIEGRRALIEEGLKLGPLLRGPLFARPDEARQVAQF